MKPAVIAVGILSTLLLAACGASPTIREYVLQPTITEVTHPFSGAIGVGPVAVAEFLRDSAIVTSADGYRLSGSGLDQWGEPLSEGIARVVTENLVALTGSRKVRVFPWRGDEQPDIALTIAVHSLNASAGEAELRLRWSLRRTGLSQPLDEGFARYQQPLENSDIAAIPRANSELLEQFSRDMAARISAASTGAE